MENKKNLKNTEAQEFTFHKVSTGILGLDCLLYGGLDLSAPFTVIFVKGDIDSERAMFGVQLMYGLAQSIKNILPEKDFEKNYYPRFVSTIQDARYINDALLDTIVSSSITILRNRKLSSDSKYSAVFSEFFFKLDNILCKNFKPSIYDYLPDDIVANIDEYICSEAVYYGNGTNALHLRTKESTSDTMNILFKRRYNSINDYFGMENGDEDTPERTEIMNSLSKYVGFNYVPMYISEETDVKTICDKYIGKYNLTVVDIPDIVRYNDKNELDRTKIGLLVDALYNARKELLGQDGENNKLRYGEKTRHRVLIVSLPLSANSLIPDHLADMVVTLKPAELQNYRIDRLSVEKSKYQTASQGWHQYKYRDYGFEVYPSLHRIFQVRRYLQRAMVYTHSDVITDTYQQYLLRLGAGDANNALNDYMRVKDRITAAYVEALYPERHRLDYSTSELLSRILLYNREVKPGNDTETFIKNHVHKTQEGVTAIIGSGNTFKRFLVVGGVFSCSMHKEHTLILMLNKDERMIRRRLTCPARGKRDKNHQCCRQCYSYIHFMNIMMGCITPEEFIYYLQLQLDTTFQDGKKIKRIVIDDMQVLDYCFPLLKNNPLFVSALAILCREREITLHILCDRDCESAQVLRAIVDNTICTDRDSTGKLMAYVERYAGYNNSPSKTYCGKIEAVSKLFECFDRDVTIYQINNGAVEEENITSIKEKPWFMFGHNSK